MVLFGDEKAEVNEMEEIEEATGNLKMQNIDKKLMRSVIESDKRTLDQAKLIKESINRGIGAFTPDLMFEKMVQNYSMVKNIVGESLIRQLTGYDDRYIERNAKIPEFQMELKRRMQQNFDQLKKDGLLTKDYAFTDKAVELAAVSCFVEEIEHLVPKGYGRKDFKKHSAYGGKEEVKQYRKGDRYRDIALKASVKAAIRRGHTQLEPSDLRSFERQSKGQIHIIFALDASGSMKGDKIGTCKKAGIALAYRALEEKDKVGLMVFGSEVKEAVAPTDDLTMLVKTMIKVRAEKETDIAKTLEESVKLFEDDSVTKHLVLITDALPTVGNNPSKQTLEMAEVAVNSGITISVVGINLDDKGVELAQNIVEIGNGRLSLVRDLEEMDRIVLEDYYSLH